MKIMAVIFISNTSCCWCYFGYIKEHNIVQRMNLDNSDIKTKIITLVKTFWNVFSLKFWVNIVVDTLAKTLYILKMSLLYRKWDFSNLNILNIFFIAQYSNKIFFFDPWKNINCIAQYLSPPPERVSVLEIYFLDRFLVFNMLAYILNHCHKIWLSFTLCCVS